ncbi:MAG: ATP-grasp domain-containing protein [Actinomycetota bacterium]|nr:ATP-grasp domain-containing protein [Actinomycetota bacterium]
MATTIKRLLIANRGEIARRIMRTAKGMGMTTIAVYAAGDEGEPFVAEADVAVPCDGRRPADTYLDVAKILTVAAASQADAVHPGYGFASERADFAAAVTAAGLVWVGPPAPAIAAMGDKLAAKALMAGAGVPVLSSLEVGADGRLDGTAAALTFPVLVKAAAGGGGKGMRIVERPGDLADAITSAQREAGAAFGDPTVFIEPYVTGARHVEIQILADDAGRVIHAFERECSIQRRHQKIIEESPSPALDPTLRKAMSEAAVAAARAVGYRNAGTVEFVVAPDGAFFFLEVNTRLQVEHPVTEAVTGLDLVREQLRIAEGHPLSVTQDELVLSGHAIEARLYAEDPSAGFLPATGTVVTWQPDQSGADEHGAPPTVRVRVDAGIETGSVVGVDWDPMLAKVIAHGPTRTEAALGLALALERTVIRGVTTNRDYLVAILRHPMFLAGDTTTSFVETSGVPRRRIPTSGEQRLAAVAATLADQRSRRAAAGVLASLPTGWRNSVMPPHRTCWRIGDDEWDVGYQAQRGGTYSVTVSAPAGGWAGPVRLVGSRSTAIGTELDVVLNGVRHRAVVGRDGATAWVQTDAGEVTLVEVDPFPEAVAEAVAGGLVAPMPGRVQRVEVAVGDRVEDGQLLVVVEAMKMEHRVTAAASGQVVEVRVAAGDQVAGGDLLVVIDAP